MEEAQPKHYTMDMNDGEVAPQAPSSTKRSCFRPPLGTPKSELMEIHRLKMQMKKFRRSQQRPTGFGLPIRPNKRMEEDGSQPDSVEQTLSDN